MTAVHLASTANNVVDTVLIGSSVTSSQGRVHLVASQVGEVATALWVSWAFRVNVVMTFCVFFFPDHVL